MIRFVFILISSLNLFPGSVLNGIAPSRSESFSGCNQDTLQSKQILYNGRVWRNLYYKVLEDQFLFSKEFLPGSVTINGKTFGNTGVRYDIYNDEIMTVTDRGTILQMNKEMIDMFTFNFMNKAYQFKKLEADSLNQLEGYVNVLYNGESSLLVKYKKEIDLLGVDNKYDVFYQTHRIYLQKEGIVNHVSGKKDLITILNDRKQLIKDFIKANKIRLSKKNPGSFIPVLEYYDSLSL